MAGKLRFWLSDAPADAEVLERAIACARLSGNHRAQMRASHWLAVTFISLSIPADAATIRAEQLLQEVGKDLWAEADLLKPLSILYAYTGRFADARAALARTRSVFTTFGATLALAESAIPAGVVELAIGDPAAAEQCLRQGYDALRAMGEQRFVANIANLLAEALYAQGRFEEAQQMTEVVLAASVEPDARAQCQAMQAMLLAPRSQFAAARRLLDQAQALLEPISCRSDDAWMLIARAEVSRLAGTPAVAAADLGEALRIWPPACFSTAPSRPTSVRCWRWPTPGSTRSGVRSLRRCALAAPRTRPSPARTSSPPCTRTRNASASSCTP